METTKLFHHIASKIVQGLLLKKGDFTGKGLQDLLRRQREMFIVRQTEANFRSEKSRTIILLVV